MDRPLRIVVVEDSANDFELIAHELNKGAGAPIDVERIDSAAGLRTAIERAPCDAVISDYHLPGFSGPEALQIVRSHDADLPFILVSGTVGEEVAVQILKAGANDYLLKGKLTRLSAAVKSLLLEAEARRSRERYEVALRRAQAMARLGHVVTRDDGSFESWSETLPRLLGLEDGRMPESAREWLELLHPEDRARFRDKMLEAGRGVRIDVEYRLASKGGAWFHIRQVIEPLSDAPKAGRPARWFSTLQDVSEQKQAEAKISRLNRVYAVLSGINTLIVRVRDRDTLFREACRIAVEAGKLRFAWIGAVDHEAMELRPVAWAGEEADFLTRVRGLLSLRETDSDRRSLVAQAVVSREAMISNDTAADPRIRFKEDHAKRGIRSLAVFPLLVNDQAQGVMALHAPEPEFFDADEVRLLSELAGDIAFALEHIGKVERLEYLASYDPLTGLANRTLLLGHLEQFLRAAQRDDHRVALFILNIERFKSINDAYGRHTGDALLKQLAERMRRSRGDPTRVGRLGGDEFALVLPRVGGDDQLARRLEDRLREFFEPPFTVAGTELRIAAKLGIALFPNDAREPEALLKNAESALKKAKETGERYVFYAPQMTERVAEKLSLENQLRQALEREEFVLHYQPKVELERRRIVGVEALIRWQSPQRGLVPPGHFIPLLEETGLILQVGKWALARASLDHRGWVERKLNAPRVAVNVSPLQLRQRDFVGLIEQAIIDGVAPTGIDLEITESVVMDDIKANIEKLTAVRGLGVRIAIDDFGTGYSSLGYLAQLPVQSLKIDRSFIVKMQDDPNAMSLVSTIISLAHSLRLKVIAEGVESEEQAKFLRLLRCDEMQGYLFSKPVPEAELIKLLGDDPDGRSA